MMSNSMQLNPPEVSLTIQTTENENEIQGIPNSDSHNPRNTPFSPYSSCSSSAPIFPDYNFNIFEHADDWGAISHSDFSNAGTSDYNVRGANNSGSVSNKNGETKKENRSSKNGETKKEKRSSKNGETKKEKRSNKNGETKKEKRSNKNGETEKEKCSNKNGGTEKEKRSNKNGGTEKEKRSYNSDQISKENFNYRGKKKKEKRSTNNKLTPHPGPEKKLTDFALQIVLIEKTASGIGLLTFIWATVVLLGGFASDLKPIDFGFISTITFMVGTGLLNHHNQLDSRFFFQATKVISSTIGRNLTILQFSFSSICIALSVLRLVEHNYSNQFPTTNMKMALYIFYTMALVCGLLFQFKKAYWLWKVSYSKLMQEVCKECGLEMSGVILMKRFFYDAYWKLSKGSVFSALNLELITFAQGLIISNSQNDQLIALRILNETYSEETCQRLKTSIETIGRLFKMLTWKENGAIQIFAARIVEKLASGLLVEDIPGGMDYIHSLLTVPIKPEDLNAKTLELNLIGLNILIELADKPKNCWKIRESRGLLLTVIEFTKCKYDFIPNFPDKLKIVKHSLMLLSKMLNSDERTGNLRRCISDIAFTMSNLGDILIYERTNSKLFKLVVEVLAAISVDRYARQKIGSTSRIIKALSTIFLCYYDTNFECKLRAKAGHVLAILVLQSKRNCSEIIDLDGVVEKVINILYPEEFSNSDLVIPYWEIEGNKLLYKISAMKILRNLCAYAGRKSHGKLREVLHTLPWILESMMSNRNDNELLEASTGLCVQICKLFTSIEHEKILRNAGYSMDDVAKMLLKILKENIAPNNSFPCLRRYAIELAIWMMESNAPSIPVFKAGNLTNVLTEVAETTSDVENFHFFSGDVGGAKHPKTIYSLVLKAKGLLE